MTATPTTPQGLRRYDHLPPQETARRAWTDPGPHPEWHEHIKAGVRVQMPLLARALDRLTEDR